MSDPKEHQAVAAADAIRASVMKTVRKQAEDVVEQLQRDVFRLLEDVHRDLDEPFAPEPSPARHDSERERERRHLDAELRQAITDMIRAEIAALDVAALVKAEIETQLRTITRLLQERLKAAAKPNVQKLTPLLSRRRR